MVEQGQAKHIWGAKGLASVSQSARGETPCPTGSQLHCPAMLVENLANSTCFLLPLVNHAFWGKECKLISAVCRRNPRAERLTCFPA